MNERIKKLAEQAGGGLSCIAEPLEHPWKFSERELEKFAELIVRECADVAHTHTPQTEECEYQWLIHNKIKEHFGVEE
jgi:hypothetical protein